MSNHFTSCPNCNYDFDKKQKLKACINGVTLNIHCPLCKSWFKYVEGGENEICKSPLTKDRPKGLTYKKPKLKEKNNEKLLRKLVYDNFKLTNLELANKLGISEMEFYRSGFGEIAKELKKQYKQQSLF